MFSKTSVIAIAITIGAVFAAASFASDNRTAHHPRPLTAFACFVTAFTQVDVDGDGKLSVGDELVLQANDYDKPGGTKLADPAPSPVWPSTQLPATSTAKAPTFSQAEKSAKADASSAATRPTSTGPSPAGPAPTAARAGNSTARSSTPNSRRPRSRSRCSTAEEGITPFHRQGEPKMLDRDAPGRRRARHRLRAWTLQKPKTAADVVPLAHRSVRHQRTPAGWLMLRVVRWIPSMRQNARHASRSPHGRRERAAFRAP